MRKKKLQSLSKRERQIMETIYQLGDATAAEVVANLPEKVGDASIRKLIRIVEGKGYLKHRREGHKYVYSPLVPRQAASRQALRHMLQTFFQGSAPNAVAALLDITRGKLSKEDIVELTALVERAEKKGR